MRAAELYTDIDPITNQPNTFPDGYEKPSREDIGFHEQELPEVCKQAQTLCPMGHWLVTPSVIAHRIPSTKEYCGNGALYSRRGRVFAVQFERGGTVLMHLRMAGVPVWLSEFRAAIESNAKIKIESVDDPNRIVAPWASIVSGMVKDYKRCGGERWARREYGDIYVTVLDSYASGNCIPGTRAYANRHMDGQGVIRLREFLSCEDEPQWSYDRKRAASWAIHLHKSRPKSAS